MRRYDLDNIVDNLGLMKKWNLKLLNEYNLPSHLNTINNGTLFVKARYKIQKENMIDR